jgi:hypothetical protein
VQKNQCSTVFETSTNDNQQQKGGAAKIETTHAMPSSL